MSVVRKPAGTWLRPQPAKMALSITGPDMYAMKSQKVFREMISS